MMEYLPFNYQNIILQPSAPELVETAARVLQEEIRIRTGTPPEEGGGVWLGLAGTLPSEVQAQLESLEVPGPEGFRLAVWESHGHACAAVEGADPRGVYYGMGRLLRQLDWSKARARLPVGMQLSSTPKFALRGHQLGYRPKTNAYDAWTPEIYDQYLRELALFGVNSVELLPPHTDDDASGPLMKVDPLEMIGILSEKAHHYGMDVWVWYPNMAADYTSATVREQELAQRREVFEKMPWLDHLFVPGGDPGDLDPEALFIWVKEETELLRSIHPKAGVWISPQTFDPSRGWTDAFYEELAKEPDWLTGVVFGPWEKDPSDVLRAHVPSRYPLRNYPDIGHSFRCQFPVENWDLAYALTLGRECINPRPRAEKQIHHAYMDAFIGSITYSEGINDDVNKFVWADQEWDPDKNVVETLRDYARLFIDAAQADDLAQGFLALENNFCGPLMVQTGTAVTLRQWQTMETRLCAFGQKNYRFEMGLIRAYSDAYQRERLIFETYLEQQARHALERCRVRGSLTAIDDALTVLDRARTECVCPEYRTRIEELADDLFRDIGMQLTVSRHGALHWSRGGFVECIDIPLNDDRFLRHELEKIRTAKKPQEILASVNPSAPDDKTGVYFDDDETHRISLLDALLNRGYPGPGGWYDDMGSWTSLRRIGDMTDFESDPGFLNGALRSFVMMPPHAAQDNFNMPLSWQQHGCAMYMTPLKMQYDSLDPQAKYLLRVTYLGYFGQHARLEASGGCLIHDTINTDRKMLTLDFELPPESYADGNLELAFTGADGERGISVAEIWIIKKPCRL